ncbi:MAG: xanthine dehydrogenase family protein subunit M [Deltaproteobacteria bacterium]|nr:xanthine dehydrogenase family protein subunit M [Deltaproteobacteria bacterium]
MIPPFDYIIPETLEEACNILWEAGKGVGVIAGGTDLVIGLRNGDHSPRLLIDITRIPELRKIEEQDGRILIGAAVTHSEIVSSPLLKKYGKILSDAASVIGSPQIRNLGTIGGNIVNASPAADSLPPLMVLNAVGKIVSREGAREAPLDQLFKGPYETNLKPHEILVHIGFEKLSSVMRSSFIRLARREAMAIARMSMAVVLRIERSSNLIKDIRISPGAVMPRPQRMPEVEDFLKGKSPDEAILKTASQKVSGVMVLTSGVRSSTPYKAPVVEALFLRAMRSCLEDRG